MDVFSQLESFVAVAARGSLSAAARAAGVTPAVMGRRMDALEARLGVKLLVRTTRSLALTHEGQAFLEDAQRILDELANAEAAVGLGGVRAAGHIRLTAPAGFGRRHVAPRVQAFLQAHPEVSCTLDLSDRMVDVVNEGFDCAIRIGDLPDSSLVSVRLAQVRRVVVASPAYVARRGVPATPLELAEHTCLPLSQQRGWSFREPGSTLTTTVKVSGRFECNDGAVLHAWALAGGGLAWRSMWEVSEDLAAGRLVSVLDDWAAPALGVHALFVQRRQLPLRVRLLIEHLRTGFAGEGCWA